MAKSDLRQKFAEEVESGQFQLPDKFKRINKRGKPRWSDDLSFDTIHFAKANFVRRAKGVWRLLPEGEEWLQKGEQAMINETKRRYDEWRKNRESSEVSADNDATIEAKSHADIEVESQADSAAQSQEEYDSAARDGLIAHIRAMDEYDFQYLVAALLRAMGYVTPLIAERGHSDGGVDIVAYRDPLGAQTPRLKVQVKHHQKNISRPDVNKLNGVLTENDIGIFVASSGFSSDAKIFAQTTNRHLELIDINRLIDLWREFYRQMNDEDKKLMPLYEILFLARDED